MEFEWDEAKRRANIVKHGIDFVDAVAMFDGPFIEAEDRRRDYGERRMLATGGLSGQLLRVVYARRGDRLRIISVRKARRNERRAYYAGVVTPGPQDEG